MIYLRYFLFYWCCLSPLTESQICSTEYLKCIKLHREVKVKISWGGVITIMLSCWTNQFWLNWTQHGYLPHGLKWLLCLREELHSESSPSSFFPVPPCLLPQGFSFWLLGWPTAGQGVAGRPGRGAGVWDVVLALGSAWRWLVGQLILHLTAISKGKRATLTFHTWVEEPATAFNQVAPITAEMWQEMLQCKQANGDWRCLAW